MGLSFGAAQAQVKIPSQRYWRIPGCVSGIIPFSHRAGWSSEVTSFIALVGFEPDWSSLLTPSWVSMMSSDGEASWPGAGKLEAMDFFFHDIYSVSCRFLCDALEGSAHLLRRTPASSPAHSSYQCYSYLQGQTLPLHLIPY